MANNAAVITVEVDGRQRYLFESDKLREMLGASRIMAETVTQAEALFLEAEGMHLFGPVSGEIRAWAPIQKRDALLGAAWRLREWLDQRGVAHRVAYLECAEAHFTKDASNGWRGDDASAEPVEPSLRWVHHALANRMRDRGDGRAFEDHRPASALFAQCEMHGLESANRWDETAPRVLEAQGLEVRRALVGFRAEAKFSAWERAKASTFYEQHIKDPVRRKLRARYPKAFPPTRPITFHDLAETIEPEVRPDASAEGRPREESSYIAFVCADGDGMGGVIGAIDWNARGWRDPRPPWRRNRDFCLEYNACIEVAFAYAAAEVTLLGRDNARVGAAAPAVDPLRVRIPLLPQLLGGDDLWAVVTHDVALPFARLFSSKYAEEAARRVTLKQALRVAGLAGGDGLTISVGVAFAKAVYPSHAMIAAAEELLRSAKALRRGRVWGRAGAAQEACLDWHWIESSRAEPVSTARLRGFAWKNHDGVVALLSSRPWTMTQSENFEAAATALGAIARRKREQLEQILRWPLAAGRLAFDGWYLGLTQSERSALLTMNTALPPEWRLTSARVHPPCPWSGANDDVPDPWRRLSEGKSGAAPEVLATVLLDLLALQHVLGIEGRNVTSPRAEVGV